MNLGETIRSSTKWLLFGNTSSRLLEFAFGVVLARLLVPADFGMILTVQVFTGFVSMLTSGGMGQSLIRAKEVDATDFHAVFTVQLALGILAYLGFYVAAPWIAWVFDNALYVDLVRVSALVYLLRPFGLIRNAWLSREMAFKSRALIGLLSLAISRGASIAMAWSGFGVWSLILSGLIGALVSNILLASVTPLRLRLDPRLSIVRRHSAYGFKIVANDFLDYLTMESKKLILSKFASPSFLGLYNKGESLAITPSAVVMPAVMQPVFRVLSKVQDDLDQTKYLFYRVITLLTAYTAPLYIGIWWVAEPFVLLVYGEKWLPAAEPLRVLALAGFFRTVRVPSSRLLEAQNRLTQQMIANSAMLIVVIVASFIGLNWGLGGVAWGILGAQIFIASLMYYLAYQVISTRIRDLVVALAPGLLLGGLVFTVLAFVHLGLGEIRITMPVVYLSVMVFSGGASYAIAFLFLPLPALRTEAARWRKLATFKKELSRV